MLRKNILSTLIPLSLLVMNCSIKEPVMPVWTTNFLIPLVKERIVFSEEFANDSTIVVKGDSLFLELSGDFDPDTLTAQDLRIDGIDSTSLFSLQTIKLDSLATLSTGDILITDFLPFLQNWVNLTCPFPDTTITGTAEIADTSQFQSMQVTNGTVEVTIYNNLPLTIAPPSPGSNSVTLALYNQAGGTPVADIAITDPIPPGGIGRGTAPLGTGDGWVIIPLGIDYQVHFLSDNIFITQDSLDSWGLRIDLSFQNLELGQISGMVSEQEFDETLRFGVEQEDQLIEATIDNGTLQLQFLNRLPLSTQVVFTLPDLINTLSGQPYNGQVFIPAGDSTAIPLQNLHGYRLFNSRSPGQVIDSISVYTTAISDTGYVTLTATDEISVRLVTSDLFLREIKGYLSPDTLIFNPFYSEDVFDYGGFSGGIALQGVQLVMEFNNDLDVENLILSGIITGIKTDENNHPLDSAEVIIPDQDIQYGHNIILLTGPEVDALVNLMPTNIKAQGNLRYSGYAEVSAGDVFSGNYIFSSPFWVQISDADAIKLDPDTLTSDEIDDNFRKEAGRTITHALLRGTVLNFSPLSGEIHIFFSGDFTREDLYDTTGYFNPEREYIKTVPVPAAPVNPTTGFVTQPVEETFSLELNEKELSLFHTPPLRLGLLMRLDDTNSRGVILRGSDYLEFFGNIETTIVFKEID